MSFEIDYRGDLVVETLQIAGFRGDFTVSAQVGELDYRGDFDVAAAARLFFGDLRVAALVGEADFRGDVLVGMPAPGAGFGLSHARRQRRFGVAT